MYALCLMWWRMVIIMSSVWQQLICQSNTGESSSSTLYLKTLPGTVRVISDLQFIIFNVSDIIHNVLFQIGLINKNEDFCFVFACNRVLTAQNTTQKILNHTYTVRQDTWHHPMAISRSVSSRQQGWRRMFQQTFCLEFVLQSFLCGFTDVSLSLYW